MRRMVRNDDRMIFNDQSSRNMLTGNFEKLNMADLERRKRLTFGISTTNQNANDYRGVGLERGGYSNPGQR
jgi:hypothetical protein